MSFAGIGVLVVTLIYTGLKIRAAQRVLEQTADRLSTTKQELQTTESKLNRIKEERANVEKALDSKKKELLALEAKLRVFQNAQLAIGSSSSCGKIAQAAFKSAVESSPKTALILPRVYEQIANESQRLRAKVVADKLSARGYIVPGIEYVGAKAPRETQVRYFKDFEQEQTKKDVADILGTLAAAGVQATAVPIKGYETSTKIRQRHYELWFGST
jgi:flagellar motility protein MotE (MotC chaperone)